jgi:hypothetical protein
MKLVHFWSGDPRYGKSMNPLYVVPNTLISCLSLLGIVLTWSWRKYRYFYLYFLYSILVVIVFFPLPRYQTMTKILVLPFAAWGAMAVYDLIRRRRPPQGAPGV